MFSWKVPVCVCAWYEREEKWVLVLGEQHKRVYGARNSILKCLVQQGYVAYICTCMEVKLLWFQTGIGFGLGPRPILYILLMYMNLPTDSKSLSSRE